VGESSSFTISSGVESGACPSAGGAVPAYLPGGIYLAGPTLPNLPEGSNPPNLSGADPASSGDPFSLVSVTSAKVGPFDVGTVVLRFALKIDPRTADVSFEPTASEPIPAVIDGIVTHVRDIRLYIDRPNFILSPTNCTPTAISSTLVRSAPASAEARHRRPAVPPAPKRGQLPADEGSSPTPATRRCGAR